ncbi:hypothetical protein M9H77_36043 [Catharanthus roseus]|uniref:Uncharacterized protein n=1 Tax=Catharanthus roseus TaxID=4058 RepID=A0ACB9ZRH8_CATRO|nr:hypothetical protein M9H77_36043 [Catharanthus roseus]
MNTNRIRLVFVFLQSDFKDLLLVVGICGSDWFSDMDAALCVFLQYCLHFLSAAGFLLADPDSSLFCREFISYSVLLLSGTMDATLMAQFQNFSLRGSEKLSIKLAEDDFKTGMEEYGLCCVGRCIWAKNMNVKAYRSVMCQYERLPRLYFRCGHWDYVLLDCATLPSNACREEINKQKYRSWLAVDTKFHEESELL